MTMDKETEFSKVVNLVRVRNVRRPDSLSLTLDVWDLFKVILQPFFYEVIMRLQRQEIRAGWNVSGGLRGFATGELGPAGLFQGVFPVINAPDRPSMLTLCPRSPL